MTNTASLSPTIREMPLDPGGSVEIVLSSSTLRIRGIEGDRVVVRTRGGGPLDEGVRIEAAAGLVRISDGEGSVRIGPFFMRTRRSPDLDIDLPRTAAVSLRTMSGDVDAQGIGGASRWASASGDLRVTVSAGPVRMESMSGDAILEATAAIALEARTVSGDLRVRAPRLETLDASTTSGDVRIEADLAPGGDHAITSISGDVDIATASPVRLEAQTIAGDVRATGVHATEGGHGRRTLVVGNGSVRLTVRTTSGDVRLRVQKGPAADGLPASVATVAAADAPPSPAPVAPAGDETQPPRATEPEVDRREAQRLDVLRALERGEMDVETATARLEALDGAGPLSFRGWS
jgi:hypothetical protein